MQKFLNNSGRLIIVDDLSSRIHLPTYRNDQLRPGKLLTHTTPEQVNALIASGSLNPYYPVKTTPSSRIS